MTVPGGGRHRFSDCRALTLPKRKKTRDVFAYVIHEGKVRAPSGAMELIARVK
jgi:hypothetical protein